MKLDQKALIRNVARTLDIYNEAAVVHRQAADEMLERLSWVKLAPQNVVDIGCGTGYLTSRLWADFPGANVYAVDLVHAALMTQRLRHKPAVVADTVQLPFATGSCDLVVSNLVLHCCDDLGAALGEAGRVLRPGGLLMFTTFGPDTLIELREAWRLADATPHVHDFIDMHDIGDGLLHGAFSDPVMDAERYTVTHKTIDSIIADLRATGETNVLQARRRGLTGKNRFAAFREAFEKQRTEDGLLPVSYEVVFGHTWKPENRTSVRVSDIA